jgi:hypothetical protein
LRPSSKGCDWQENRDNSGFKFTFCTHFDLHLHGSQHTLGRQNKLSGHASADQVCMYAGSHPESNFKKKTEHPPATQIAYWNARGRVRHL